MRLGGFYGLTAFSLLLLDDEREVADKIAAMNADMNATILKDLSKEFLYLGYTVDNFPFMYDCAGKNDARLLLKKCSVKDHHVECTSDEDYNSLLYALAVHMALLVLRSQKPFDLGELKDTDVLDVPGVMMGIAERVLQDIDQTTLIAFDRKFREKYSCSGICDVSDIIIKAFSIEVTVNPRVNVGGKSYELSEDNKKVILWLKKHRIAELEQQVEKGRDIDERIQRIKERRTVGRTSALDRGDTRRVGTERPAYRGTEDAAQRISDLEREIKQREQSREYSSIKERLEAGRQSIAEREREAAKRKRHDRGMSR